MKSPNVLAVDLGGTKCSAAVVDRTGRIFALRTLSVDLSSASAPIHQIVQLANDLAGDEKPKRAFLSAAIAVPGLVRRNGTVWAPNLPGWEHMPLARRLKPSLGVPVLVESDRNAAVLGECWRGAGRGKTDVVVLMIGTGMGAGILSGGRLLRGSHELSGCAGWLTVTREELPNVAGLGELESLASGPGIARAAQQRLRNGEESSLCRCELSKITAHEVAAAAREGDRFAKDVFATAGKFMGYGIANMISILDPQVVVLGGGLARVADLYLEPLRKALVERAQPLAAKQVKVEISKLTDKANLLGCARMAWDSVKPRG
jgi:glucokinase